MDEREWGHVWSGSLADQEEDDVITLTLVKAVVRPKLSAVTLLWPSLVLVTAYVYVDRCCLKWLWTVVLHTILSVAAIYLGDNMACTACVAWYCSLTSWCCVAACFQFSTPLWPNSCWDCYLSHAVLCHLLLTSVCVCVCVCVCVTLFVNNASFMLHFQSKKNECVIKNLLWMSLRLWTVIANIYICINLFVTCEAVGVACNSVCMA